MSEPPLAAAEPAADPVLAAARIRYQGDQPFSVDFADIYHAPDGAAEVQRVFLGPCGIDALAAERARRAGPRQTLRIGELGFGSGFNFVLAAERCLAAGARLHFTSVEAAPIDAGDFAAIAAARGHTHPLYRQLAERYPPRIRGWHRRWLADGRICLSLWWGDAQAGLDDLAGRQQQPMDAWFLDGFAPDRNPAMWTPALLQRLATLSRPGSRVATFTAAGFVRRGLQAAGFAMRRIDQRPHKRETLAGELADGLGITGFEPPATVNIAGAGLAGASAAWHLARAGYQVRVWEPGAAADASPPGSSVPVTVLHGRLLADGSPAAALRCHAYLYAADLVRGLAGFPGGGVIQRPGPGQAADRLAEVAARYGRSGDWVTLLDRTAASRIGGWPLEDGCLYLPGGGTVATPTLVATLLAHPGIETVPERLPPDGVPEPCILACGAGLHQFADARHLELAPVAGQIDLVAVERAPRLALVGNGYLVPDGEMLAAGTTYEYRPWDPARATAANVAQLAGVPHTWRARFRGTRSVSSDRAPVAGTLHDVEGQPLAGRYVSGGHGSSGNVFAHLAGAVLTALIGGDCPPLARPVEAALAPARFRERQARRGYRHGARD